MAQQLRKLKALAASPAWLANPKNKELLRAYILRSKEPYYRYEPYRNRSDGSPSWQIRFMEAAGKYKARIAFGGNRIGKTISAIFELCLAIAGEHPYRNFPIEGVAWIVSVNNKKIDEVILPMLRRFLPSRMIVKFRADNNTFVIHNDNGGEWTIILKSGDASVDTFAAAKVDIIVFDEEPPEKIMTECMARLIDSAGVWWMAATPVLGTAWLKGMIDDPVNFSISGSMWENPYLPFDEVKKFDASLSEDEREVRVEGRYLVFGGKPVFPIKILNTARDKTKEYAHGVRGEMEKAADGKIDFVPRATGRLLVFEYPEEGTLYTLGGDAATGHGADFTAIPVFSNQLPFHQVAIYHVKETPQQSIDPVDMLGRWYNNAMAVIESRFPGNSLIDGLVTKNYPNLYAPEQHLDADPTVSSKFGISTTEAWKWLLIREGEEAIRNCEVIFRDIKTIDEFCQFVYLEDKNKTGAAAGLNDDRVIASLLALHGCKMYPQRPKLVTKHEDKSLSKDIIQQREVHKRWAERSWLGDLVEEGVLA